MRHNTGKFSGNDITFNKARIGQNYILPVNLLLHRACDISQKSDLSIILFRHWELWKYSYNVDVIVWKTMTALSTSSKSNSLFPKM